MTAAELINQSGYSLYFLVADSQLAVSLYPEIKNFYVIAAYKDKFTEELKRNNIQYFCLEENGIRLSDKNSGRLLEAEKVVNFINQTTKKNRSKAAIMPFKPSAKIEKICRDQKWTLIANKAKINRLFEDKFEFARICIKNKIPMLPYRIINLNKENFEKAQKDLGNDLVIQTHFGWAGKSTFKVKSEDEIIELGLLGRFVKVSPFVKGCTLLNNACIYGNKVWLSPSAVQFNGINSLSNNPFATVGRQWPSLVTRDIDKEVEKISYKLGEVLKTYGYQGYFGIDFLVANKEVYVLECNPRLTASFAFFETLESDIYINSLLKMHIAAFLGIKLDIDEDNLIKRPADKTIIGAEISKRNREGVILKKISRKEMFSRQINPVKIRDEIIKLLND